MSSSALTQTDHKFWAPNEAVVKYIASKIPDGAKVLEIGPGHVPFPKATHFVDAKDLPLPNLTRLDLHTDKLPFADQEMDYVFCRHVIEDMYDPFPLIAEMKRVGRAGYIETPSPVAECCRGIDGGSPPFRGYHHHRFITWVQEGTLHLVSKYALIEYLRFTEEEITGALRQGPKFWNTHFEWTADAMPVKHIQNGIDMELTRDYANLLRNSMDYSRQASDVFFSKIGS